MTAIQLDRLTHFTEGDLVWEFANTATPGKCPRYGWCDGDCTPLRPGHLGDMHTRYIASALRDRGDLVEICVGQWKADPAQPWQLGASAGCYDNKDRAPKVGIAAMPAGPSEVLRTFLKPQDAEAVALTLRLLGHDQFADAMDAAAKYARRLEEEK